VPDISNANWVAIAHLLRPQGRRGELLAEPLTSLTEPFAPDTQVWLSAKDATQPRDPAQSLTLEELFFPTGKNAGRIVLKLTGCDTISQAELLAGQQVMVPAQELPTLDPGTYYVSDLVGCTLFNGNVAVGTIVDVQFAMAPDGKTRLPEAAPLLGLELPGVPEPILIPFVLAHLESVDLATKRIHMHLPEGLLDPPQ